MARQARKNTNLVENVKEINQWYYTCKIGVRVFGFHVIEYYLAVTLHLNIQLTFKQWGENDVKAYIYYFTCILNETTKIYEEKFVGLKKIQ
jgi:hypothetical protein